MIDINAFFYDLPEEKIAKHPVSPRDHSKLLVYDRGHISEDSFYNLAHYLPEQSLLVYNDTRVIHARLVFYKESGSRIEVFCLEPIQPADYQLIFSSVGECTWKCFIGNAKKWKSPQLERSFVIGNTEITLKANIEEKTNNAYIVHFHWGAASSITFGDVLECIGEIPIPPYLNRQSEESDNVNYQTVYSKIDGSVAAPTAGLHFTTQVLQNLHDKNINIEEVTLHVGAGTFQPVKVQDATQHIMHKETFEVKKCTIQRIFANIGNITAVGTTTVRTLESLFYIGEQVDNAPNVYIDCFNIEQFHISSHLSTFNNKKALENILNYMEKYSLSSIHAQTQIMIYPGYAFQYTNRMITNFHQPKSTLLLLISAFVNNDWEKIYTYALDHQFRFLSYGDSSLLIP